MRTLLQINTVVNSGSTGRIAEEIGQLALSKGWKSYIAYGRNPRPSQSELIKIGNDWDMKYHGLQTRLLDRHGLASVRATKQLITQIREINPTIIHLHNIHGYYLNYPLLFNFLSTTSIPVVWTLHDCWPMTGHCTHFEYVKCEKWKNQCFSCPQKKEYPASLFLDRSFRNYELKKHSFNSLKNLTLIPVSKWLADIIKQSFLKNFKIDVIHNGINNNVFKQAISKKFQEKYCSKNKFILLGVASTWSPRKGLKDFIELSRKLDSKYQIILVGLTQKQIKKIPSHIITLERTESMHELAELYATSDIFLNPTYEDNFPTTNLEAMACGTPVITYETGGSPEAIDKNTGYVVQKGDIDGMVNAIKQIKKDGKEKYSQACIQRVQQNFQKEDRFNDYLNLYDKLLTQK